MNEWSRKERFEALLSGEKADRPMVSGWRHFLREERSVSALADITVSVTHDLDWDWVKINPRATYYVEAWGNTYDFNDYRSVFPKQKSVVLSTVKHLHKVSAISIDDTPALREQVQCAALIRKKLPDTPLTQTLFSPLTGQQLIGR